MPHQGCKTGTRGLPLLLETPRALLGMTAALQEGSHGAKTLPYPLLPNSAKVLEAIQDFA